MKFKGQDILSTKQFDKKGMEVLFKRALKFEKKMAAGLFSGKILATLFFEPSTRTRFSFESAFLRGGGSVISGADMMNTSSIKKRETLYDTGKVVSCFADIIVMRHPEAGSVVELARGASVPVINAGDGSNQHPTQALLDVYTMWKEFGGRLSGKVIGMVGDLKNGRVPHSQCDLLRHWNVKFVFVSPKALRMPSGIVRELREAGREVVEVEKLEGVIGGMDVICATRIQEERFASAKEAAKYRGVYVIDKDMMKKAKKSAILLHPLPRVDEIAVEVDSDPRARYFEQVKNGVFVRMALMAEVMGV
jgi:aspartate carbamoyltransferase catalytic subunit